MHVHLSWDFVQDGDFPVYELAYCTSKVTYGQSGYQILNDIYEMHQMLMQLCLRYTQQWCQYCTNSVHNVSSQQSQHYSGDWLDKSLSHLILIQAVKWHSSSVTHNIRQSLDLLLDDTANVMPVILNAYLYKHKFTLQKCTKINN